jgi:hypothetical protein
VTGKNGRILFDRPKPTAWAVVPVEDEEEDSKFSIPVFCMNILMSQPALSAQIYVTLFA